MPATGADIPPELFIRIIRSLQMTEYSSQKEYNGFFGAVQRCTLVCLYWAQHCRRMSWPHLTININSQLRAEEFRRYCLSTSTSRLEPITELARSVDVFHQFQADSRPWLHLLFLSAKRTQLAKLKIRGPAPSTLSPALLRTPYWGIPRSIPRTIAECNTFTLINMSFSSLDDVISFAGHFVHAEEIRFVKVEWPPSSDQQGCTPMFPVVADTYPAIFVLQCTDPAALFLRSAGIGPAVGPLHALASADQIAVSELVRTALTVVPVGEVIWPRFSMRPTGSRPGSLFASLDFGKRLREFELHFLCQPPPYSTETGYSSQEIEAIALIFDDRYPGNNVTRHCKVAEYLSSAAWTHVARLRSLRTVLLVLPTFSDVLQTRDLHATMQQYVGGHLTYFSVACKRSEEHQFEETEGGQWVVIDPNTLVPTGETWKDPEDVWWDILRERHGV